MPNLCKTPCVKCCIPGCEHYGKAHKGIHVHAHQPNGETVYLCTLTGRTFNQRKGSPFARMKKSPKKLEQAMKLLSRGSKKLASYAGLVPSLDQSGDTARHGRITKQGNKFIRTAMVQASRIGVRHPPKLKKFHDRMLKRLSKNQAKVATARKMLTWLHIMLIRGEPFAA